MTALLFATGAIDAIFSRFRARVRRREVCREQLARSRIAFLRLEGSPRGIEPPRGERPGDRSQGPLAPVWPTARVMFAAAIVITVITPSPGGPGDPIIADTLGLSRRLAELTRGSLSDAGPE
jgi:hypothetical protein